MQTKHIANFFERGKKLAFFLSIFLLTTESVFADPLTYEQQMAVEYTYPTPFGNLTFIRENGSLGTLAKKLSIADNDLLVANSHPDGFGYGQSLMSADDLPGGVQTQNRSAKKLGRPQTKRLVVLEGPDGNCIRQLVILDFTGERPFVSDRFGYNPDGKACLKFKRAKWGKKESYIYLEGPMKYIYYTGGKVIGPID